MASGATAVRRRARSHVAAATEDRPHGEHEDRLREEPQPAEDDSAEQTPAPSAERHRGGAEADEQRDGVGPADEPDRLAAAEDPPPDASTTGRPATRSAALVPMLVLQRASTSSTPNAGEIFAVATDCKRSVWLPVKRGSASSPCAPSLFSSRCGAPSLARYVARP